MQAYSHSSAIAQWIKSLKTDIDFHLNHLYKWCWFDKSAGIRYNWCVGIYQWFNEKNHKLYPIILHYRYISI